MWFYFMELISHLGYTCTTNYWLINLHCNKEGEYNGEEVEKESKY